ncbi:hypothetical protein E9549_04385 [Blastococcus sp. MG754426]|uniref:hypothetical protein n=1 Tax=unclassified Blastococcus TaxID=2619396 RepID=UPI001EF0EEC6|nr:MULTISPECIES: hypothetical protein [unclassified Blastococcus]MCF6506645.1 hypothetical protein [Blastococcus sp. MG754426]MCF6510357.1 hypothetical protein [Blastococcus sp. MG754427]
MAPGRAAHPSSTGSWPPRTLIDDGLVLDGRDGHDAGAVVGGICRDLVVEDPGAALRARVRGLPCASPVT